MDGIHTTFRWDCVMRCCAGLKRKWCLPLLVHQPIWGSHFDLRHSTICDCSFRCSNTIADKMLRQHADQPKTKLIDQLGYSAVYWYLLSRHIKILRYDSFYSGTSHFSPSLSKFWLYDSQAPPTTTLCTWVIGERSVSLTMCSRKHGGDSDPGSDVESVANRNWSLADASERQREVCSFCCCCLLAWHY